MSPTDWEKIPSDLRNVSQWCIAAPDKSPFSTSGYRASVVDHTHWTDWYSASTVANTWGAGSGIGFVLNEGDGFACIDLDVKDSTPPEEIARYHRIISAFDSYTEHSKSGRGYHIWVRGDIGAGCRRDGVEIYSQERFIICTGNTVHDKPIAHRQEVLDMLVSDIRRVQDVGAVALVDVEQMDSDETIWTKAAEAANGAKFNELWNGQWKDTYPSQSEADLSLLSILTFYSKSNEQVRRMFRLSELGKRDKSTKNDKYLNRTLGLIRGRQAREDIAVAHGKSISVQLLDTVAKRVAAGPKLLPVPTAGAQLDWPPGHTGMLAQYLYRIAPRPFREVAILAALGVFAGVFGRAYNISNSGLNLYLVLVAKSAVGKEALHSGIGRLVGANLNGGEPLFGGVMDFSDYASGPALVKAVSRQSSFLNISGEWGRKLRKMADDNAEGPMSTLRTVMTNLYQKSAAGNILGGIGYSDKDKDVASVDGVAYSMIGETTPATFYESLTNTMMQDGFMSRFIVLEYTGQRPELNEDMSEPVPEWFCSLMRNFLPGIDLMLPGQFFNVPMDAEATEIMRDFNKRCDVEINGTDDESWRQMWNRAHLKGLKVAAVLAVAQNPSAPMVTKVEADWALELVKRDIKVMGRKMVDGDVGDGDMVRERKVLSIISVYLHHPVPEGYKVPDAARVAGVVPRKYLQMKTQHVNSFAKSQKGASSELDRTVKSLMDSGYLVEVAKDKIPLEWGSMGRCYRVLSLPDVA